MEPLSRSYLTGMPFVLTKPFNLVAFNLMWLGCVLGRADWLWLVAPGVLAYCALLILTGTVRAWQIAVPAAIGIAIDAALTGAGLFHFPETPLLLPLWLLVLWLAFATTLTQSLAVVGRHKWVAAACGAVAFPFNYGVGERLGAVSFHDTWLVTVIALACIWALLLPVMYWLVEKGGRQFRALV